MLVIDASCLFEVVADTQGAEGIRRRLAADTDHAAPHLVEADGAGPLDAVEQRLGLGPATELEQAIDGVETEEVEEVLQGRPRFRFVEKGRRAGEDVYMACGQTDAGRYLSVLFIYKPGAQALILSARDMAPWERKRYERK